MAPPAEEEEQMENTRRFGEGYLVEEALGELVTEGLQLPTSFSGLCSHFKYRSTPGGELLRAKAPAFLLQGWVRRAGDEPGGGLEISFIASGAEGIFAGRLESARINELEVNLSAPALPSAGAPSVEALSTSLSAAATTSAAAATSAAASAAIDLSGALPGDRSASAASTPPPAPRSWGDLRAQQGEAEEPDTAPAPRRLGEAAQLAAGRRLSLAMLRPGDQLQHPRFGSGRLIDIRGETLSVQFSKPRRTRSLNGERFEYLLLSTSRSGRRIRVTLKGS